MQDRIEQFILYLRKYGDEGRTKNEIMRDLGLTEKQFKRIVKKLKEICLLQTWRDSNNVDHYYLSYDSFSAWLKLLRDTVYNVVKRGRD